MNYPHIGRVDEKLFYFFVAILTLKRSKLRKKMQLTNLVKNCSLLLNLKIIAKKYLKNGHRFSNTQEANLVEDIYFPSQGVNFKN